MALQSSGAISLANIAAEFGGATPHSLSEYYGAAAGIPTSGAIDFADFYGASSQLDSINVTVGYSAPAKFSVESWGWSSGNLTISNIGSGTPIGCDFLSGKNYFGVIYYGSTLNLYLGDWPSDPVNDPGGWSSFKINGITYLRSNATFGTIDNTGNGTSWRINYQISGSNPFLNQVNNTLEGIFQ